MKLLFLIATCERPGMLARLVRQINFYCSADYSILVVDDNSQADYSDMAEYLNTHGHWYERLPQHNGKQYYWRTVTRLFQKAQEREFDYAYKLDDDTQLHPDIFDQSMPILRELQNRHKKHVLNFWVDHRSTQPIWTGIRPKKTRFGGLDLRRVGWVDGGGWVANRRSLEAIRWQCPQPPDEWWEKKTADSSGVGKYLSIELNKQACRIYMPEESLIYHGEHESIMNAHKNDMNRPIEMNKKPWL